MTDKEKEYELFDLEDILKEFGEEKPEPESQPQPDEDDDVRLWGEAPVAAPNQDPDSDTIRLNRISQAVRSHTEPDTAHTVRFSPVEEPEPAQTLRFSPVEKEPDLSDTIRYHAVDNRDPSDLLEDVPLTPPPVSEAQDAPFSENWEPDYEEPIGEYTPQEPIVFQPKSRIHELKRQLVEGPERRYYELAERGVGKLQAALFLSFLVTLLSAGAAVMHAMGMVQENRIRLLIFGEFFLLMFSALLGSYQLIAGIGDLLRKRFSLNTLLVFSLAACIADAVICLAQVRVSCCAAFSLTMTMSLWASYQRRNTEIAQMDTLRRAPMLDGLFPVPEYYEGRPGFLRDEGCVADFMDNYDELSGPGKVLSGYALTALLVSMVIGITAGVHSGVHAGIRLFCASLLVAIPASSYITLSRPTAILERRLHRLGTVLCGWQGIRRLCTKGFFPISDQDLFPEGSAKLNGVKFFGNRNPDDIIAYAAALINVEGGGMVPLFDELLDSRNGYHYEVSDFHNYGNGGIGGVINDEAVLVGSLTFMQDMGVDMHEGTRVSQALYAAIDGQLCGVFAVNYAKVKSSASGLSTLCGYRGLIPMLTSTDFMLTESMLRSKFGHATRKIVFPSHAARVKLAATEIPEDTPAAALTTRPGLASSAFAVTGARALRASCRTGVSIHMVGGILGLIMMILLAVVNRTDLLTPANILLYELIWMLPSLLITEWTRII